MITLITFLVGAVLGFLAGRFFAKRKSGGGEADDGTVSGAVERRQEEMEKNLTRVRALVAERALTGDGRVTNSDVENLLGVSDATATRYLDELEKEGEIKQIGGERGRGVYYEKR